MNADILERIKAVSPQHPIDEQVDLGRVEITPAQHDDLAALLGIDGGTWPTSYIVGTLISRVKELDTHPKAVSLAGKPDDLRRLAEVAPDADAAAVVKALAKKYHDATSGQDKSIIRRARQASGKE